MIVAPLASIRRVAGPMYRPRSSATASTFPSLTAMLETIEPEGFRVYILAPDTTRSAAGAAISPENKAKIYVMDEVMERTGEMLVRLVLSGWNSWLSVVAAVLISALFLVAGVWKIIDAPGMAVRLAQLKVPQALSLPAAVLLGIAETFCGVLILVPR